LKRLLYILLVIVCGTIFFSCSTKKNTASTRRWQAFVTRYNVYYNADQAYIEGRKAQDKGLKENYTQRLPLMGVGYEKQRSLGKSNFETAITKCEKAIQLHSIKKKPVVNGTKAKTPQQKAYLSRKEFNPFLKNAWLLMGKAQFQKGEFAEAAASFSYITRFYAAQPEVVAEARVWLARCYAELEWFYDAEDVLQRIARDTMPKRLKSEYDLTRADYLIRQDKLEEALPLIKNVVKKEKSKARKARLYYLLGQTYMALDNKKDAYKSLSKCIAQSPAYEMAFHARILQTEALTTASNSKSMIKRLKRMTKRDVNKDYLDQIYYAIGNIYMEQVDTLKAIGAYETGREKATQKGPETAVLLLRLGGIYWDQRRFDKAQPCYTEAIGLLDKEHEDYKEITRRSKVLDALVPPTSAIFLQDSLQWLASLDEPQRNEAIDRVIEQLKKKEAEEKKAKRDSAAQARQNERGGEGPNGAMGNNSRAGNMANNMNNGGSKDWYFYNAQLVSQGKQSFQKEWGNRKNEDDWRRNNRTVIANTADQGYDYEAEDSIAAVREAVRDSLLATGMSEKEAKKWMAEHEDGASEEDKEKDEKKELAPEEDPHKREYYLAQIPFTEEQKAASDSIIRDALFEAGVIEKDKLEDFDLASGTFLRLERDFPNFAKMDEATYHMFLLYSRWAEQERQKGNISQSEIYKAKASQYREKLRSQYPDYAMTPVVCDPDFEYNARYGRELEDSLYTLTYNAYREGDNVLVAKNFEISTQKFPKGANRPKFIFIHALSSLGTLPTDSVTKELRDLAKDFPKSDVAEMAGMIVKGLEEGRAIGSGGFDLGGLWSRRSAAAAADNAAAGEDRALSPDRDVPFVFLIAYPTDSDLYGTPNKDGSMPKGEPNKTDDKLLYDLAKFNFTTYVYRGFDISKDRQKDITQFRVNGFRSYDDVHSFAQRIFHEENLAKVLRHTRIELISEKNLQKLGSLYSFEEYRHFYDSCFAPLDINPDLPLEFEPEDEGADGVEYDESLPEKELYDTGKSPVPLIPEMPFKPKNNDEEDEDTKSVSAGEDFIDDEPVVKKTQTEEIIEEKETPVKVKEEEIIMDEPENQSSKLEEEVIMDEPEKQSSKQEEEVMEEVETPVKKTAEEFINDIENSQEEEAKTNSGDDFIADDDTETAKKSTKDDDFILDDDKPAKKSTKDDDDFILDDDKPAKKSTKDDDFILDDDKPAKKSTKDDDDYYEE